MPNGLPWIYYGQKRAARQGLQVLQALQDRLALGLIPMTRFDVARVLHTRATVPHYHNSTVTYTVVALRDWGLVAKAGRLYITERGKIALAIAAGKKARANSRACSAAG